MNTSPRNDHMLRFLDLYHIQLNHGDSDKAPSYRRVFRMFDKNFVAGQAAIDRFASQRRQRARRHVRDRRPPPGGGRHVADRPIGRSRTRHVLYAPTWYGYLRRLATTARCGWA